MAFIEPAKLEIKIKKCKSNVMKIIAEVKPIPCNLLHGFYQCQRQFFLETTVLEKTGVVAIAVTGVWASYLNKLKEKHGKNLFTQKNDPILPRSVLVVSSVVFLVCSTTIGYADC